MSSRATAGAVNPDSGDNSELLGSLVTVEQCGRGCSSESSIAKFVRWAEPDTYSELQGRQALKSETAQPMQKPWRRSKPEASSPALQIPAALKL